ncbi:MAG: hypothetical protein NTZ36_01350 [Candidatus Jorgensenbacteria bacterium]|nr:hypothetical protein [Candidatus Jorgensenbacteria bacterium]
MNNLNSLFSSFGGVSNAIQGTNWMFVYLLFKYVFLALDIALIIAIIILIRKGLSYRIKIDLKALPPTIADILKRSGAREQYFDRWVKLRADARSTPPASYSAAIIGADAFIDEILKDAGFIGNDAAERFGRLNSMGLKRGAVNGIFRAHKIRNQIAHDSKFSISESDGERVLNLYEEFLREVRIVV